MPALDLGPLRTAGAYPLIRWEAEVLSADGTLCEEQPIDGPSSGVQTLYATPDTELASLSPLSGLYACGGGPLSVSCPSPSSSAPILATQQSGSVLTVSSGSRSVTLPMPDGYELGETCCADGCCNAAF